MAFKDSDVFKLIQKQIFCVTPSVDIKFKDLLEDISWEHQETFMYSTFLHPIIQTYPLKREYQISCLKIVLQQLESQPILEINDLVFETFCNLTSSSQKSDGFSYKHYLMSDGSLFTIKESAAFICNGTTGLCSWQAAKALGEWIIQNKEILENKNVLELGSGTGLLGIVAAKVCLLKSIMLSDCHPVVLQILSENVRLNHTKFTEKTAMDIHTHMILEDSSQNKTVGVLNLPWESIAEIDLNAIIKPDYLIASDIIFDNSLFSDLMKTINNVFEKNAGCTLIMSCTVRNPETLQEFLDLLESNKYDIEETEQMVPKEFHWDVLTPIRIFIVTKRVA